MNTPVRWLEAGADAPNGAAELLSAAAAPPAFTEALRSRLAMGVAHTAALPVASPWTSLLVKGAFLAGVGGAGGLVVHALAGAPSAPVAAPAPIAAPAPVALPQHVVEPEAPSVAVDALPSIDLPAAPIALPKLKLDPRLAEAELLEKARSLVGSNPAAALKLTVEHGREFPKGRLGAEADLIAAQALVGMGNTAAAKQRARASLARYPSGLYARQLRDIVNQ